MSRNIIIGIVHTHANYVLRHATQLLCRKFQAEGRQAGLLDLSAPDALQRLGSLLNSGDVGFAFGLQGIGSRLETGDGENLWLAARVPFLGLHYDHPCYNPVNHISDSPYVGNFYFFPSFLEAKQTYLPSAQIAGLLPYEILQIPPKPRLFFSQRPIKMLFMKTGASLDEPIRQLNFLDAPLRDAAHDQLAAAQRDPNLSLCDLVQDIFTARKIDRAGHPKLFWGMAQVMDIYLRRKRAIDLVEWLKFRPHAVIVGDGWDFIRRRRKGAQFRPSMPAGRAFGLYQQARFVFNTNPYGRDIIHERILHGLLMGCNVISDANAWIDQSLGDIPALHRFDWSRPLDDQLPPVLEDYEGARQAVQTVRTTIITRYRHQHTIPMILQAADEMAAKLRELAASAAE